ncbi:nucleotidyltransferase family protein [Jannaschia sp. S6380]|nr:nucleotidyltransferase family protein [Jannaschia sp. S6380]MCK0168838.1 nucleotidyltransferase family protein [Jannaschia sp. S6380]
MVFAAGRGTRMRPLTDDRPKAMVRVAGRPLIDHALDQVATCAPVAVNAHHFADRLIAHLHGRDVAILRETPTLLETGGGLRNALPALGAGPVLTMNADAAWTGPRACDTLTAAWDPARMDGLLLMVPKHRVTGKAGDDFTLGPDGRLSRGACRMTYTGAGIVKTDLLGGITEDVFSLWRIWTPMLAAGTLFGVEHPGRWADVGAPGAIAPAEAMLAAYA